MISLEQLILSKLATQLLNNGSHSNFNILIVFSINVWRDTHNLCTNMANGPWISALLISTETYFMGLLFLKVYASESVNESLVKLEEKTSLKWAWTAVYALSYLQIVSSAFNLINTITLLIVAVKVSWRERLLDEPLRDFYVFLDGRDLPIK